MTWESLKTDMNFDVRASQPMLFVPQWLCGDCHLPAILSLELCQEFWTASCSFPDFNCD